MICFVEENKFVPFYWSFSAIVLSVILRITASEYHFGFCKLFGKKLLRAYVVLFYYVPNQNKVFLLNPIKYRGLTQVTRKGFQLKAMTVLLYRSFSKMFLT
jgi:hypothetical protein